MEFTMTIAEIVETGTVCAIEITPTEATARTVSSALELSQEAEVLFHVALELSHTHIG
jgi:hypothetical protein